MSSRITTKPTSVLRYIIGERLRVHWQEQESKSESVVNISLSPTNHSQGLLDATGSPQLWNANATEGGVLSLDLPVLKLGSTKSVHHGTTWCVEL